MYTHKTSTSINTNKFISNDLVLCSGLAEFTFTKLAFLNLDSQSWSSLIYIKEAG
ncbi:unnamed protein product, partial [Rotaria sp. Silwood2]